MSPITFSTQTDLKDYIDIAFKMTFKSKRIIAVYAVCLLLLFMPLVNDGLSPTENRLFMAFALIFIVSFPLRIYRLARNRFKSTPNVGQEKFWAVDESGIEIRGRSFFQQTGWANIVRFSEDKKVFFIWYNNSEYSYFLKCAISESQLANIRQLFFQNGKKGY